MINLASALIDQGDAKSAQDLVATLTALGPMRPDVLAVEARLALLRDDTDLAITKLEAVLALSPDARTYALLANAFERQGEWRKAAEAYGKAGEADPSDPGLANSEGMAWTRIGEAAFAITAYQRAQGLAPDAPQISHNLAVALMSQGRFDESLTAFDHTLTLAPDVVESWVSRGGVLQALNRFDDAAASYAKAIALAPDYAPAHADLALCLFKVGRLEAAWGEFEWRWKIDPPRPISAPLWLGDADLAGRTILLHGEQGLGDILQFSRYIPRVAALGAKVLVGAPQALVPLFENLPGVSAVAVHLSALPEFDYHCPFMSLGLAFRTGLQTIPSASGLIRADADRVAAWLQRLGAKPDGTRLRIGLAWSGNPLHRNDRARSLPFAQFVQGLPRGHDYHVLQNHIRPEDEKALAARDDIRFHGQDLTSFVETAALTHVMDYVVSVDTSLAHLAGTLERPGALLIPKAADWRWMIGREDSPWYPSLRLFRQVRPGDWDEVLLRLYTHLDHNPLAAP